MAIDHDKLNTKLNAILAKDLDSIMAQEVYLPFMGKNYTRPQLEAWLKKRLDLLIDIRDGNYTDLQITKFMDNVYKTLSASDKLIADSIMAGESSVNFQPSDGDNYEKLVLIMLYKFVMVA